MTYCEDCSRSTSAWILSKKKWPRLKRVRELKALFYVLSDRFEVCSFAGQPSVSALRCSTILLNLLPSTFSRLLAHKTFQFFFTPLPPTIFWTLTRNTVRLGWISHWKWNSGHTKQHLLGRPILPFQFVILYSLYTFRNLPNHPHTIFSLPFIWRLPILTQKIRNFFVKCL